MCIKKKVVIGLAAAGVALYLIAPGAIGAAVPLLILAICPLSMIVMMRAMSSGQAKSASPDQDKSSDVDEVRAEVERLRLQKHSAESFAPPTAHS